MITTISRIPKQHDSMISAMMDLLKSIVSKGGIVTIAFLGDKARDWDSFYEFKIEWPESSTNITSYTESPENDPDENRIEITNIVLSSEEIDKPIKAKNRY
jgi:hypothetical protein